MNWALLVVGLTIAFVYSPGLPNQSVNVQSSISSGIQAFHTPLRSLFTETDVTLKNFRTQIPNIVELSWTRTGFAAILIFSLLGICLIEIIRNQLAPADALEVAPNRRSRITLLLIGSMVILALGVPSEMRLFVVAFGFPLVVATTSERMTYPEINKLADILNRGLGPLLPWLDQILFQPRGIRVCITPTIASSGADQWAADVHSMYRQWVQEGKSDRANIKVQALENDGGGRYDLMIWGSPKVWRKLMSESGYHVRHITIGGQTSLSEASPRQSTETVLVQVVPSGVAAQTTVGMGLQLPVNPSSTTGTLVAREYVCTPDQAAAGGFSYNDVTDPRTGIRSRDPNSVLGGSIDLFLESRRRP